MSSTAVPDKFNMIKIVSAISQLKRRNMMSSADDEWFWLLLPKQK